MAAVLVILGIVCCCSSSVASALAIPFPGSSSKDPPLDGFKEVASGRGIYDPSALITSSSGDGGILCAENCQLDFTCNGFNTWDKTDSFGFTTSYCMKRTTSINPLMTLPGWILKKNNSKIFTKNS